MNYLSVLALLALTPLAVADTTKILSKCYTGLGKSSAAKVGTTSYAVSFTFKVVQTKTFTPSTTVTPKASTLTATRIALQTTTTSLPRVMSTFTSTILQATTQTSTLVLPTVTSNVDIAVTTTITSTSTIATPNGFVPLRAQFPNAKRAVSEERRGRLNLRVPEKKKCASKGSKAVSTPALYPSTVKCAALVNVYKTSTITKTAAKASTITAPTPLVTVSVTTVSVITSTIKPVIAETTVFTTSAFTSLVRTTVTPTSVVTSTTTVTETQPGATIYAACGANNQVASVDGTRVGRAIASPPFTNFNSGATDPYDCCVDCQITGGCYGYYLAGGSVCFLLGVEDVGPDQCGPRDMGFATKFDLNGSPNENGVVGNGPCGQLSLSDAPL